jgi:hypothetical protein
MACQFRRYFPFAHEILDKVFFGFELGIGIKKYANNKDEVHNKKEGENCLL